MDKKVPSLTREQKLAAKLRENLRRRKTQTKVRAAESQNVARDDLAPKGKPAAPKED